MKSTLVQKSAALAMSLLASAGIALSAGAGSASAQGYTNNYNGYNIDSNTMQYLCIYFALNGDIRDYLIFGCDNYGVMSDIYTRFNSDNNRAWLANWYVSNNEDAVIRGYQDWYNNGGNNWRYGRWDNSSNGNNKNDGDNDTDDHGSRNYSNGSNNGRWNNNNNNSSSGHNDTGGWNNTDKGSSWNNH